MGLITLKILIVALFICLILLLKRFKEQKTRFENKEYRLMCKINSVKQKQTDLNDKVKLSESFNQNYQQSRNTIAQSIYEANVAFLKNNS